MKLINLTPHELNFTDGSVLEPSGNVATVEWQDAEKEKNGLTLVKRQPILENSEIEKIKELVGDNFGIVSFPVVSAARGTELEGKIGSVMMKSRNEKIAFPDKFSI